jgi:hypothetical protein
MVGLVTRAQADRSSTATTRAAATASPRAPKRLGTPPDIQPLLTHAVPARPRAGGRDSRSPATTPCDCVGKDRCQSGLVSKKYDPDFYIACATIFQVIAFAIWAAGFMAEFTALAILYQGSEQYQGDARRVVFLATLFLVFMAGAGAMGTTAISAPSYTSSGSRRRWRGLGTPPRGQPKGDPDQVGTLLRSDLTVF